MFDQAQKTLAVTFARTLAAKDYEQAYGLLSQGARSRITREALRADFESMIPPEVGEVTSIELLELPEAADLFVYVGLGGDVYSEAVIVEGFTAEDGTPRIDRFQFGRP